jgi:hypothetical protein
MFRALAPEIELGAGCVSGLHSSSAAPRGMSLIWVELDFELIASRRVHRDGSAVAIGRESEIRSAALALVPPTGRRPMWGRLHTGCGGSLLTPRTAGRVSVVHAWPALCLTGEGRNHVSGKRCSELDLLGCDSSSGCAARGFNTRATELASCSLLIRDDVRAASSSSPVVCRIVGAPPLCAPARVIPGRTLLEGEGRGWLPGLPSIAN